MSEVSLRAAWGAYRKYAPSKTLEGLLYGIAEGRRQYGPAVRKIYSFIDVNDRVQLFYCQNPGEEEQLLSSPHPRQTKLVYANGDVLSIPSYLQREFDSILQEEAAEKARTVPYVRGHLGIDIRERLQVLSWDLSRPCKITFEFDGFISTSALESFQTELRSRGLKCGSWMGSKTYAFSAYKDLLPDVEALNALGDELYELAWRQGCGKISVCELSQIVEQPSPLLEEVSVESAKKRPWWKFW